MGFKFRKSFKIAPGVKLNFNKKSTGITLGGKGVHYTLNSKGKRTTSIGVPGTGLYYSTSSGNSKKKNKTITDVENKCEIKERKTMSKNKWYQKSWAIVLFLIIFFPVGLYLMWKHSGWSKLVKIIITAFFAFILIFGSGSDDIGSSAILNSETQTTAQQENSTQDNSGLSEENKTIEETTEETSEIESTTHSKLETEIESTKRPVTTTKKETTTHKETTTKKETTSHKEETTTQKPTTTKPEPTTEKEHSEMVWIPQSGKKYHSHSGCSGMKNPSCVTLEKAKSWGYTACKRCY